MKWSCVSIFLLHSSLYIEYFCCILFVTVYSVSFITELGLTWSHLLLYKCNFHFLLHPWIFPDWLYFGYSGILNHFSFNFRQNISHYHLLNLIWLKFTDISVSTSTLTILLTCIILQVRETFCWIYSYGMECARFCACLGIFLTVPKKQIVAKYQSTLPEKKQVISLL